MKFKSFLGTASGLRIWNTHHQLSPYDMMTHKGGVVVDCHGIRLGIWGSRVRTTAAPGNLWPWVAKKLQVIPSQNSVPLLSKKICKSHFKKDSDSNHFLGAVMEPWSQNHLPISLTIRLKYKRYHKFYRHFHCEKLHFTCLIKDFLRADIHC